MTNEALQTPLPILRAIYEKSGHSLETVETKIQEWSVQLLEHNLTDDTHAYIHMDCKGGNPVSALGVGGNGPWKNKNCSPHLEVAFRPCVFGELHKITNKIKTYPIDHSINFLYSLRLSQLPWERTTPQAEHYW